jgi:tetratricopeptide (TPR) repeat protein
MWSRTTTALCALLLTLTMAGGAAADQNDPRLAPLFQRLHDAASPDDAEWAELQIWNIWLNSPDAEINGIMHQGVERMSRGDYAAALKAFDTVVTRAPDFAEGWNKRASVLYLMGDYAASIRDVEKTLALEPRHFGALSGLGLINAELGNEEAALDAFEKALAINPSMGSVRQNAEDMRKRIEGRSI